MGKSSPTGLQLKHIPDLVVMQTVYTLQNTWVVWLGGRGQLADGIWDPHSRYRKLSFRQRKVAHLDEIAETLKPIPKKLIWKKLLKLEDKGWLMGHGPSGAHFAVTDEYWESVERGH